MDELPSVYFMEKKSNAQMSPQESPIIQRVLLKACQYDHVSRNYTVLENQRSIQRNALIPNQSI